MSLREKLGLWRIGWSWPVTWTGAESDLCLKDGCGVKRKEHIKMDHQFVEEK